MSKIVFDTWKFIKRAEEAGIKEKEAAFFAEEISNVIDANLASKQDIAELKHDISDLKKELIALEYRMIIKLGGLLIVAVSLLSIVNRLGH